MNGAADMDMTPQSSFHIELNTTDLTRSQSIGVVAHLSPINVIQ